ncbi:inositol monophosphatase family protein [Oricola cellulosilytica]|uniref:Inositol-1-monophosphatase n=1 Tax=Oricola cellulosilytica TaxID=1429082 RepID=A0A4R0PCS8_9HYPH|nr:inositol monophosphatase family protein [Oricola cellulosilytica]TCD15281.1 inositol monophosphatase [Oricola cellulosilytica]
MPDAQSRLSFAIDLAERAAQVALRHFRSIDTLTIETKGHQDLVSNADRDVETFIREEIAAAWPEDGIVGEEHAPVESGNGHVWVIDPIDGTANFVRGIPSWCVVIACTFEGRTEVGVICEPSSGETFSAARGHGAFVNGKQIRISGATSLSEGSVGTGYSSRIEADGVLTAIRELIAGGGMFFRNASGALMLAYVAAGRLIGYLEEHMNSWDCIAALLMIEEAGGTIMQTDPATVIDHGTMVVAGGPGVYAELETIAFRAFAKT